MSKKHFRRSVVRRAAAGAGVLAAALALVACGNDDGDSGHGRPDSAPSESSSASDTEGRHNAADVSFAQQMIPHHQQAVEMADLALERASSDEVRNLADQMRAAQAPEGGALAQGSPRVTQWWYW